MAARRTVGSIDTVELIKLPDEVEELPPSFAAHERTMIFKELQLAGWQITWKPKWAGYIMSKNSKNWRGYRYVYNFKTGRYENASLRAMGRIITVTANT